jgi:hypothetical protein
MQFHRLTWQDLSSSNAAVLLAATMHDKTMDPAEALRLALAERLSVTLEHMLSSFAITFGGELTFQKKTVKLAHYLSKEQAKKYL